MLRASAAVIIGLFPAYAVGQVITANAKCIAGYDWTFNSINQSPCDVAASLGAVCTNGTFNILSLDPGFVYVGPTKASANSCRCSSVYYSMLSACAYCQGNRFLRWSIFSTNCSVPDSQIFSHQIPVGVNVPSWAYLNVTDGDTFNITRAQQTGGSESTRVPISSSTGSPASTSVSSHSRANTGAIAGGVVGGVVGLALIGCLIAFLLVRKKRSTNPPSALAAQDPNMGYAPHINSVYAHGSGRPYDPSDPATFPIEEHHSGSLSYGGFPDHTRQSPFMQSLTHNYTGSSGQGMIPPPRTLLSPMRPGQIVLPPAPSATHLQYSGAPEV